MSAIPFLQQERPESCIPACVRMVLARYGVERSEAEVYACCETDADGTLPSAAARCIRQFGLKAEAQRLKGLETLQGHLNTPDCSVIVHVNLATLLGVNVVHAVVVEAIDGRANYVRVVDPAYPPAGRRTWPLGLFEMAWRAVRYQALVITPTPA